MVQESEESEEEQPKKVPSRKASNDQVKVVAKKVEQPAQNTEE